MGRIDHCRRLAKVGGPDGGRCDNAEGLGILGAKIVEPMNSPTGNTEGLPGPYGDRLAINGPGEDTLSPIDGLFIMVMAVSGGREAPGGGDTELEGGHAAVGGVACD